MAIFNRNNMLSDYAFEDMGFEGGLFDNGSFNLQDLLNYSQTPEPFFVAPAPVYIPEPVYTPEPVAAPMLPPVVTESLFMGQPVGAVMPTPEFVYQPAYQPMPAYEPTPAYQPDPVFQSLPFYQSFQQDADAPIEQVQPAQPVQENKPSSAAVIDSLTNQILGSSDSSKWQGGVDSEQAAKDMAKIMAGIGITDISQFGKITQTGLQEDVRPDGRGGFVNLKGQPVDPSLVTPIDIEGMVSYTAPTGTQETYGNKLTNQAVPNTYSERQTGNAFGGTFEGKGNTGYRVDFDASGKPVFYTTGASSSDAASALPFIQMALLATGAGGLLGNALLGPGASQVAANSLGGAILGGGTSAITGGDILKGALLGGAGGALSGYLAPEVPVDAVGTPTIDPEAFMTPDVSYFEAPPTNTLFPAIEAPPIDVSLPYIAPESFMTPELPYMAPSTQPTYIEPEAFMTPATPVIPEIPFVAEAPYVSPPEPVYVAPPAQPAYVEPESFMTPDISYFETPLTDTFLPVIEAPPIDVSLPPITETPAVTLPDYIEPESFMTPMPVEPTPVPTPTYVEPESFMTPQAPIVTEAPIVAEAPVSVVDNIPELVITPTPEPVVTPDVVAAAANPPALTLADLGIDYSLNNGSLMKPLTDMGGAQGVQPGTSANLPDMGGGQGLTINLGEPSLTLEDALANFGGINPAPLPDMGGAQGLTYQTPTGLVTEGGLLATGIAGTAPSVLGETGVNTATNIGSNIGVTPPVSTNPLDKLSPYQIANIVKSAVGLFGAINAPKMLSNPSMMGALPTQGVPLNTQDYFDAIQQNYNTLLPALPRDVSTPLANWYNSQYGA